MASKSCPLIRSIKLLFFKSPNLSLCPFPHSHSTYRRRLRVADILLADEDNDAVDTRTASAKHQHVFLLVRPSVIRLGGSLLAALRLTKERRILQRRQKMPSSPMMNELKAEELDVD